MVECGRFTAGLACAALIASLLVAGSAWAQPEPPAARAATPAQLEEAKARARVHFERGIAAYKAGKYKDAIDAFLDGHREFPSPVLSFNAARAYEKMGDSSGALRFYREYLRQSPDAADRAQVEPKVSELEAKLQARGLQQVTVLSTPDGSTVVLDDRPVGVTPWTGEILPGRHRLRVRREGFQEAASEFELSAHKALDVSVTLEAVGAPETPDGPAAPAPAPGPEPAETEVAPEGGIGLATWVTLGLGVAALGGAAVFEVLRAQSEDDVRTEPRQIDRKEAFDSMEGRQTTARVLAGVGAAAIVVGGVLLYLDLSKESAPAQVGLGCEWSGCAAAVRGRW
jgi:tetratricopeptide (TPR) repeat protein